MCTGNLTLLGLLGVILCSFSPQRVDDPGSTATVWLSLSLTDIGSKQYVVVAGGGGEASYIGVIQAPNWLLHWQL